MSESPSIPSPPPSGASEPFKDWKECARVIKEGVATLDEEKRLEYIGRIRQSSDAKLIAFECLNRLVRGKDAPKYRWLEEPLTQILGDGSALPHLALLENPVQVGKWVGNQLSSLETLPSWKAFFASGRHLWVLYCLSQCRDKRESLIEGLTALANGLAHWQNLQSPEGWKNGGVQPVDPGWIAGLLEDNLVAKFELPKAFVKTVYAINAAAEVGASARSELKGVWRDLDMARRERDEEAEARRAAESREKEIAANFERTKAELESCRLKLSAEKEHTTRTGGFTDVARRETVQQVLSDVRQGLLHRLEDIRAFADREKPNGEEIVELVKEIQGHLAKLETRLLP